MFQIVWIAQVIPIKTTISWCVVLFFLRLGFLCYFLLRQNYPIFGVSIARLYWCWVLGCSGIISTELFVFRFLLKVFQTIFSVFALTFKMNYFVNTIIWFNGAQYFRHLILVSYYMIVSFIVVLGGFLFFFLFILFAVLILLIFWIARTFLISLLLPLVPLVPLVPLLLSLLSPSVVLRISLIWH